MIEVGQRVWAKDHGGDGRLRGGIVMVVLQQTQKVIVAESWSKPKSSKVVINTATLPFEEIDFDMTEDPGPHARGELVRALMRRMGTRNHAHRTADDERDIGTIDALWSA